MKRYGIYSTRIRTRMRNVKVREGVVRIGRNEDCPCGSGEKYKACCGGAGGISGWLRRRRAEKVVRARMVAAAKK
jgi:uncharacterized protein YchJ